MWHAVEEAAKPNGRSDKPSLPIVKYIMKAWCEITLHCVQRPVCSYHADFVHDGAAV